MDLKRSFALGLFFGLSLMGCAGFSAVKYYGLSDMDYTKGVLLGPNELEDIPFATCQPTNADKSPCVILPASEFFRLRQELEETKAKLYSCENDH